MSTYPYEFEGPLERHGVGRSRVIWYRVLFLPDRLARSLPFDRHPRLRVRGEIADVPVSGAWLPTGDGRRYFLVSPAVCRAAQIGLGTRVEMRFRIDDPTRVDLPDELSAALERDRAAADAWRTLTPGTQRGLAHLVASARTAETRSRRLAAVLEEVVAARAPTPRGAAARLRPAKLRRR